MQKVFKNTFEKGLLTDISDVNQPPNTYLEANAVALYSNSNFTSLTNFRGNTELESIVSETLESELDKSQILGMFFLEWFDINAARNKPCLTIFTGKRDIAMRCYVFDIEEGDLYAVWANEFPFAQSISNSSVDLSVFGENGTNNIYFTDNFGVPRKLVCEFPNSTSEELSRLLRPGTRGSITADLQLNAGGFLLAGSYQFVYRMANLDIRKYTSWSPISSPVYNIGTQYQGEIGDTLNNNILVTTTLTTLELTEYTHYQLAVITSLVGDRAEPENAVLLDPIPVNTGSFTQTYTLRDNSFKTSIPLTEITIEQAAIKSAKTVLAKDNRLLLGNITYRDLDYDNGDPIVDVVTTARITQNDTEFHNNLTDFRGYFRGETYRFYVSYFDEFGNYSRPKAIDFSADAGHQDFTFPSLDGDETLLNSSGNPQQQGLQLVGLRNHPTWAIGFVILRAKRIKNILFQSPLVPSRLVQPPAAVGGYPTDDSDANTIEASPPPNQSGTYQPKSFLYPHARNISRRDAGNCGFILAGFGQSQGMDNVHTLFGPESIVVDLNQQQYDDTATNLSDLTLETVNVVFPRIQNNTTRAEYSSSYNAQIGEYAETNLSIYMEAFDADDYYHRAVDVAQPAPAVDNPVASIDSLSLLDNNASRITFPRTLLNMETNTFGDYEDMQAEGLVEGTTPTNLRSLVAVTKQSKRDVSRLCFDSDVAGQYTNTITNQVTHFSGIPAASYTDLDGIFLNGEYSITTSGLITVNSAERQYYTFEVVNVTRGLGADRYGDPESLQEIVSTGTMYIFDDLERQQVKNKVQTLVTVDVWGGDCYINRCRFKIATSPYGLIPDSLTSQEVKDEWGVRSFREGANEVSRPYPLKNVSVVLDMYLETEVYMRSIPNNDIQLTRTPYDYTYNVGLSKENSSKTFLPYDTFEKRVTDFRSRILYSDTKIFQSDEEGFDRFPTGNFYDMDETYGGITKLAVSGEDVFAIQERGVAYVPVGRNVIQTADADALSVRTDDFIGKPLYINTFNGSEAIRTIVNTPDSIIFFDVNNKQLIELRNRSFALLSDLGVISTFNTEFEFDNPEDKNLHSYFDVNNGRYVIINNENRKKAYVFNRRFGVWETTIDFTTNTALAGVYGQNRTFTVGEQRLGEPYQYSIFEESVGNYAEFYGEVSQPSITFVVNPDPDFAKTFDNIRVFASRPLQDMDILVERPGELIDLGVSGMNLDVHPREGYYRAKILKDQSGQRLRGDRALVTMRWNPEDQNQTFLNSVITKYRQSTRII